MQASLRRFALAILALAPWWLLAVRAPVATDLPHLRGQLHLAWALAATAWIPQLWLVEPSLRTLRPVLLAASAIALGLLAGGVPGLVLLVLLSWTALEGSPEASAVAVRASWRPVALCVAAIIAVDLAIPLVTQLAFVHVPLKKPPVSAFAASRKVLLATAAALVVISPIAGLVLARLRKR
jgi:hypothetical protein